MRIMVLAEGDPESWDSWSGSSRSLVQALRARGHAVTTADVSAPAWAHWLSVAASWSPARSRWIARHHLGPVGFWSRSRTATSRIRSAPAVAILQIGATFRVHSTSPTFLYCDSNVSVAERNAPYGAAAALTPQERRGVERRERTVYAGTAGVFTMSEYVRASFVQDFDLDPGRVTTVYAGANLDPAGISPRTHPPAGPPTILFVGRQWIPKGGPVLLEAFRAVRQSIPDARLMIVGCDPQLGSEPGIEVHGFLDKHVPGGTERLESIYRSADVFCFPSRFDAFGIVLVEAMLHGLACVATDRAAIPEIVAHDETGWLFPDGDSPTLARRLIAALSNRTRLLEMGRRGRERASRLFTWDGVAARVSARMETAMRLPLAQGRTAAEVS